jgi:phosphocarrier protein HPr
MRVLLFSRLLFLHRAVGPFSLRAFDASNSAVTVHYLVMHAKRVTLRNATGFHVRPATLFMERANAFRSAIQVFKDAQAADGKSAISLMLLEADRGAELTIQAEGDDEVAAVDALVELINSRFGERATESEA